MAMLNDLVAQQANEIDQLRLKEKHCIRLMEIVLGSNFDKDFKEKGWDWAIRETYLQVRKMQDIIILMKSSSEQVRDLAQQLLTLFPKET